MPWCMAQIQNYSRKLQDCSVIDQTMAIAPKSILKNLVNTKAAGMYMLVFAISIGAATFIENDFGTSAAQKLVYKAWWFELLLALFGASIIYNMHEFRMIKNKRWALLAFHSAIIVILVGAGITRYFGYEGIMHIREGGSSNVFMSAKNHVIFEASPPDAPPYKFDEEVLFASLGTNHFEESYSICGHLVEVKLLDFIPNPVQEMVPDENGAPLMKIVTAGAEGREEHYLMFGQQKRMGGAFFNFTNTVADSAVNIFYENNELTMQVAKPMPRMAMATQKLDTLMPGQRTPLAFRSLYMSGRGRFVPLSFEPKADILVKSGDRKVQNSSMVALRFLVAVDGVGQEVFVSGQSGAEGEPAQVGTGDFQLAVSYGAKPVQLPFSISLYDFIMERYPGTNSAASYASEVHLDDPENDTGMDYRIYMNHILDYRGYRFFQSSFDRDELGTYLSVNHDFWGTWVSYAGYMLLTAGMILVFVGKDTRFAKLGRTVNKNRTFLKSLPAIFLLLWSGAYGQEKASRPRPAVSEAHAEVFAQVIVQDVRGRMKPMHTMTREIMRKVYGRESYEGANADQAVLAMYAKPGEWFGKKFIKIGRNEQLQNILGVSGGRIAYKNVFNMDGTYKLAEMVQSAMAVESAERGIFEKDLIKLDERVNILGLVFSGSIFKILPVPGDPNHTWVAALQAHRFPDFEKQSESFFKSYKEALALAMHSGDFTEATGILSDLKETQKKHSAEILPSQSQVSGEIWLNNSHVFNHLAWFYALLGIGFLILLFVSVFSPALDLKYPYYILFGLVLIGFSAHTLGLGLRWYVSGRAPWSNGYESMIYIAYTSVLAGVIFTRQSLGGLAATMILGGTLLGVSMLSFLDPEITPLVPVLRSYWLTIHVSLEAGSYGFLMLGAIIGFINLLLFASLTNGNKARTGRIIAEMTHISEMTLTGGLAMISIGTYLGGVWANESWGRYWGWDAKETWALATILVYAFILHMRIIPKINGLYHFNVASLFGLGAVIMTYFGVNYYLSGLHSYAAGDPVPIPSWVYVAVAVLMVVGFFAWVKKRRFGL